MRPITDRHGLRDWMSAQLWEDTPSRLQSFLDWWHRTFDLLWVRR